MSNSKLCNVWTETTTMYYINSELFTDVSGSGVTLVEYTPPRATHEKGTLIMIYFETMIECGI